MKTFFLIQLLSLLLMNKLNAQVIFQKEMMDSIIQITKITATKSQFQSLKKNKVTLLFEIEPATAFKDIFVYHNKISIIVGGDFGASFYMFEKNTLNRWENIIHKDLYINPPLTENLFESFRIPDYDAYFIDYTTIYIKPVMLEYKKDIFNLFPDSLKQKFDTFTAFILKFNPENGSLLVFEKMIESYVGMDSERYKAQTLDQKNVILDRNITLDYLRRKQNAK